MDREMRGATRLACRATVLMPLVLVAIAGSSAAQAQTTSAPAYVLVELDIKDEAGFAEYGAQAPATITQHGGAVIVNAVAETIEGAPPEGRVIVIRFDSAAAAKGWLESPEYTAIKGIRQATASTRQLVVEGLPAE